MLSVASSVVHHRRTTDREGMFPMNLITEQVLGEVEAELFDGVAEHYTVISRSEYKKKGGSSDSINSYDSLET